MTNSATGSAVARRLGRAALLTGLAFGLAFSLATGSAAAQMGGGDPQQGPGPAMAMGGRMVRGTVTATTADHLTLKTEQGESYQVVVTPNTQVRKGREQVKLADVHAGDGIGAMGEVDQAGKTVHALFLMVVDAEQLKKAREAMGKTVIAGTVTAIDELKLTIMRTDQVSQVIQVDEDTSFKRGGRGMQAMLGGDGGGFGMGGGGGRAGRQGQGAGAGAAQRPPQDEGESLTLADVKVGDVVGGQGSIKNGIFVPKELQVSDPAKPRQQRRRPDGGAPPAAGAGEPK